MTQEERNKKQVILTDPPKYTDGTFVEQQGTTQPTTPTQPITPTDNEASTTQEQQPSESQRYLDQIFAQYEERKKQNAEADKRDRVREAIGGIGDVASALAKLHYTTQYAPYVPSENLSDKARQRYEKAKANRDANLDQWMHYVLNVAGKKQADEQHRENLKLQNERYKAAQEKAEAQEKKAEEEKAAREAQRAANVKKSEDTAWVNNKLVPEWEADYYTNNGRFNQAAAKKKLDDMLANNEIDSDRYNIAIDMLDDVARKIKAEDSKRKYYKNQSKTNGNNTPSKFENQSAANESSASAKSKFSIHK